MAMVLRSQGLLLGLKMKISENGKWNLNDLVKNPSKQIFDKITVDDIFYCMHDDPDAEGCRKPDPGLIIKAQKIWDIDLKQSLMVGDTKKDLGTAENAGIKFILISRSYNNHINTYNRISKLTEIPLYLN